MVRMRIGTASAGEPLPPAPSPLRGGGAGLLAYRFADRETPGARHAGRKTGTPPRFGEAGRGSRVLTAERTAAGAGPRSRFREGEGFLPSRRRGPVPGGERSPRIAHPAPTGFRH